jgi:hypothetical protein
MALDYLHTWPNGTGQIPGFSYVCPHCGDSVSPANSYRSAQTILKSTRTAVEPTVILTCPKCTYPTISIAGGRQFFPSQKIGSPLRNLPPQIEAMYEEARGCSAAGAHTACAMVARKLLMNLAVSEGAPENLKFAAYVDFLSANGHVPKRGKGWVDRIRLKGNEAVHELPSTTPQDAADIMTLLEYLLRFNFALQEPPATA